MKLQIDQDFRDICRRIAEDFNDRGDASLVWSDDQYQSGAFCGGWAPSGANGPAFYFSYYAPDGGDYIFSFSVTDAMKVSLGGEIDPVLEYGQQQPDW